MAAVLQGPSGQTILGPASLTIGRTSDNQLVVSDAQASSYHATVSLSTHGYSITDLGSTNGTFINEQRLEPNVPHLLSAGERIRIGDTTFTYEENARVVPTPIPMGTPYSYNPYEHTEYGAKNPPSYPPYAPPVFSQSTEADGMLNLNPTPPPPGGPSSLVPLQSGQQPGFPPTPSFYGQQPPQPSESNGGMKIVLITLAVVLVLGLGGVSIAAYILTRPQPVINLTSKYQAGAIPAGSTSTTFHISGYKFSSNSAITFLLDGNPISGNQNIQSDSNGNVSADLSITDGWSLGNHTLTAKDAGGYATQMGVNITIVPQGAANTPGPNGAPSDDATFKVTVTLPSSSGFTDPITLDVIGGTVCQSDANDDGQPHTFDKKDKNGNPYQETIIKTCTGTYKSGKFSYTEKITFDKDVFLNDGFTCTAMPFTNLYISGTYSSPTTISGSFSEDAIDVSCSDGNPQHLADAQSGTWDSQQSATSA